jgi:nicotinamide riboside transporter PnuC
VQIASKRGKKMLKKDGIISKIKWDWLGVILAVTGIILNSQKIIWCWPFYMTANVFMAIHFAPKKEYPIFLLETIFFFLNIFGWYSWAHN